MPRVEAEAIAKLTVQRSRFLAVLLPARTEDDVKAVLEQRRRKLRKARHHCWAARLRDAGGKLVEYARDDGEVGRPGTKMLEVLRRNDLEGAIVVSRFFGGVKLGSAGVGRAFKQVAEMAVEAGA